MPEKPVLLDANAVLRYLLEDNDEQADEVCQAVASGTEVTLEVLAECVYVLSGVYGVPRSRVAESLGLLLDDVACQRRGIALAALGLWSGSGCSRRSSSLCAKRRPAKAGRRLG